MPLLLRTPLRTHRFHLPRRQFRSRVTGQHADPAVPAHAAKVAVPLLLLALACYAVGFWALTRI